MCVFQIDIYSLLQLVHLTIHSAGVNLCTVLKYKLYICNPSREIGSQFISVISKQLHNKICDLTEIISVLGTVGLSKNNPCAENFAFE